MARLPNPHPEGCFWHDLADKVGAPNVKWCEPTICSVVSEPANTWSNLGYMAVAAWIGWTARTAKSRAIRVFGPMAFLMGLFSLIYHASNNYLTQVFDFIGMFLYVYLLLVINLRRLNWLSVQRMWTVYSALVVGSTALVHVMYLAEIHYQLMVAVGAVAIVGTEALLYRRGDGERYSYKAFWASLGFLVVAQVFSILDGTRTWCEPDNLLLHGHALWHMIGSISVLFAFLHYRQMRVD